MVFGSVCSGIESASVAWAPLGWRAAFVSEIEPFPCHVLAHRHGASRPERMPPPDLGICLKDRRHRIAAIKAVARLPEHGTIPNHGDMTTFKEWPDHAIDLLVGGTPCQSFSVAGLRKGLADPRGNLMLTYLAIAQRYRPKWLVWENVPGVLSDDGNAFGTLLRGLAELGYGFAYRVLDAQYIRVDGFSRAVPQRRRRVFVVGHSGDWRRAAAVLFERSSLQGNPPPRREAGQATAPTLSARTKGRGGLGTDFDCDGGLVTLNGLDGVSHALTAKHSATGRYDPNGETFIGFSSKDHGGDAIENVAPTLRAMGHNESHANAGGQLAVAHALRGEGFDASEDGTGRGTPIVPVAALAFHENQRGELTVKDTVGSLKTQGGKPGQGYPAVAFDMRGREGGSQFEGPHDTANIRAASGGSSRSYVAQPWCVRRLTPMECERLQGFPDGYTQVPYRGKDAADGPRYKGLGNSMAIPPMRWLGQRIQMVDDFKITEAV